MKRSPFPLAILALALACACSGPSSSGKVGSFYPTAGIATDLSLTSQAQGDLVYFNGTNWVVLAPGTSGQFLKTNGAAANPTWTIAGGATVGAYGSRPAAGTSGRLYYPTDGVVPFVDDGSNWRPIVYGYLGIEPAPANSIAAYTATGTINTTTVVGGTISLYQPTDGGTSLLRGYTVPKTTGKSLIACIDAEGAFPGNTQNISVGITVGDTADGSGRILLFGVGLNGAANNVLSLDIFTNKTTYSSTAFSLNILPRGPLCLEACNGSVSGVMQFCFSQAGPNGRFVCYNDLACGSATSINTGLSTGTGFGTFYGIGVRSTTGSATETVLSLGQY